MCVLGVSMLALSIIIYWILELFRHNGIFFIIYTQSMSSTELFIEQDTMTSLRALLPRCN